MDYVFVLSCLACVSGLLLYISLKFHNQLKQCYFLIEFSTKSSLLAFAWGCLIWILGNLLDMPHYYIEMIAVAPGGCILVFTVVFYIFYMPAYIFWDAKSRISRLVSRIDAR